jgi:hypothetical protein
MRCVFVWSLTAGGMVMCAYYIAVNLLKTFKGTLTIPLVSVSFLSVGGAKLNRMKMELITVDQQAKHLKKHLPKSWKRFVNQRILEHKDNNVTEPFKCFDEQYWKDVYSALANER